MKSLHKLINTEVVRALNENKTKMIVKRLKEDANYKKFFNNTKSKFGIDDIADLEGSTKKKEFFNYLDKNYTSNDEK